MQRPGEVGHSGRGPEVPTSERVPCSPVVGEDAQCVGRRNATTSRLAVARTNVQRAES